MQPHQYENKNNHTWNNEKAILVLDVNKSTFNMLVVMIIQNKKYMCITFQLMITKHEHTVHEFE